GLLADTGGGFSSQNVYDFGNGASEVANDRRLMSADGRFSVFASRAPNIVSGQVDHDAYAYADVFLYDHVLNQTTLVSHSFSGPAVGGDNESFNPVLSADGRFVAFESSAQDLVAGYNPGPGALFAHDVYLYDRATGDITLVSHSAT